MNNRTILIVNPNSSESMTEALKPLVQKLGYTETSFTFFTSPSGPASINNDGDCSSSEEAALPTLLPLIPSVSAVLIACYSAHPLVGTLKRRFPAIPITGIFEASVTSALNLIGPDQMFGIVSTGVVWRHLLTQAVKGLFRCFDPAVFAGVDTTGLDAGELHTVGEEVVKARLEIAVKTMLGRGKVGAICLGCAGMAGMDELVRSACIGALGEEKGRQVWIIDGVLAGVTYLEGTLRAQGL